MLPCIVSVMASISGALTGVVVVVHWLGCRVCIWLLHWTLSTFPPLTVSYPATWLYSLSLSLSVLCCCRRDRGEPPSNASRGSWPSLPKGRPLSLTGNARHCPASCPPEQPFHSPAHGSQHAPRLCALFRWVGWALTVYGFEPSLKLGVCVLCLWGGGVVGGCCVCGVCVCGGFCVCCGWCVCVVCECVCVEVG